MGERLTNGLHDELWINGARALPNIYKALVAQEQAQRVANAIAIAKELHMLGVEDDQTYKETLCKMLELSGFKLTE